MKISWLGHSAFKLEESTGTVLVADPYSPVSGHSIQKIKSDIVTVSCESCFNALTSGIEGTPTIISRPGSYDIEGVHIHGFSEATLNKVDSKNIIYKYRLDGVDVCHMGNINSECTTLLVETIAPIDVLLIPVGGHDTIDADLAKEYVEKLMPNIVIPMHFKEKDCDCDLDKRHDFVDLFDEDEIEVKEEKTIEFDRYNVDSEETKILLLKKL